MSLTAILAAVLLTASPTATAPSSAPSALQTPLQVHPQALIQAPTQAPTQANAVIFTRRTIPDGDVAVEIGVWAPAQASSAPRPLVVISHGNGGDYRGHEDTARALAAAGVIVASLTHTGDNWRDQSAATDVARRPRQLSLLIEAMVADGGVDPHRIGAFGFSAGGFTVLTAAGGEPDLGKVADHCRLNPGFYDCRLIAAHSVEGQASTSQTRWAHSARIKAIVVAAPALGFTFAPDGLAGLRQPVQLWQAGSDQVLPAPFYVEPVRDALPGQPEFHTVPGAGHFDFLPPCSPQLAANAPMICTATPGFDRAAFHDRFNAEIVRFFREAL